MTAMKSKTLAAVAICALALTALGSLKNPVTRPVKGIGHIVTIVDTTTGWAEFTQWGAGTHLGRWTDTGEGQMGKSGLMGDTFDYFVWAHGTCVAANGDTFDWEITSATGPSSNRYTSGTGRFQGITGGMTFTITSAAEPFDNGDGTMTLEFTYDMVGEITY